MRQCFDWEAAPAFPAMTSSTRHVVARLISTVGHPAVVVTGSILLLGRRFGFSLPLLFCLAVVLIIATGLTLWSRSKVRQGRWKHMDASIPHERGEWNKVAFVVLAIGAIVTSGAYGGIAGLGLGCCAFILAVAIVTAKRLKLSQHVAFATLSIFIAGFAGPGEAAALSALTIAVAWSRVVLGRHTRSEVLSGAATGVLAGLGLLLGSSMIV
jgi:hypothetical protein